MNAHENRQPTATELKTDAATTVAQCVLGQATRPALKEAVAGVTQQLLAAWDGEIDAMVLMVPRDSIRMEWTSSRQAVERMEAAVQLVLTEARARPHTAVPRRGGVESVVILLPKTELVEPQWATTIRDRQRLRDVLAGLLTSVRSAKLIVARA